MSEVRLIDADALVDISNEKSKRDFLELCKNEETRIRICPDCRSEEIDAYTDNGEEEEEEL